MAFHSFYLALSKRWLCIGLQIKNTLNVRVDKFAHNGGAKIVIATFTKLEIHPIGAFHGDKAIRIHDGLGEKLMRSTVAADL